MYKNILIAIDSSKEAGEVVNAAKEFAGSSDAALSLITVIPSVTIAYGTEYGMMGASTMDIEHSASEFAKGKQDVLEKELGVQCTKTVVVGQPASEIRDYAETINADLIVMGSHGRHGLGLLLGSTANGVLHGAPCSVFVVRLEGK